MSFREKVHNLVSNWSYRMHARKRVKGGSSGNETSQRTTEHFVEPALIGRLREVVIPRLRGLAKAQTWGDWDMGREADLLSAMIGDETEAEQRLAQLEELARVAADFQINY